MAKELRLRIRIGYTEDGEPVIRQLSARSELELGEKVLRAFVQSGRIREFFPQLSAPQQSETAPAKAKWTNFKEYSDYWRKTYKQGKAKNTEIFIDSKQSVLNDWFGEMNIEEITSGDVQEFLNARAKKCKKATVKADWGMLRQHRTKRWEVGNPEGFQVGLSADRLGRIEDSSEPPRQANEFSVRCNCKF